MNSILPSTVWILSPRLSMQKTRSVRAARSSFVLPILLGALALSSGCPEEEEPPPPPPPPDDGCVIDVNFPTRDPETAVDLALATPVTGRLCPAFDDDGYRVNVENPGSVIIVTLSMTTNITNVNPAYQI